ncbi:MAG: dynamin family protein [Acidobacteriota bacterium]
MSPLNENHQRYILAKFKYVDKLLSAARETLAPESAASPFQEYVPDASPAQCRAIDEHLQQLQKQMAAILKELAIVLPTARSGALHRFRTSLQFAQIAIEELKPRHLRGYGAIAEEDSRQLERISQLLQENLRRMQVYVADDFGKDLQERLQRLERTSHDGRLLRQLERVIRECELAELLPTLAAIAERITSDHLEIGIFGQVNSGKSSLLNYLLKAPVLPVGVTPVTSVPVRVQYGHRARVLIHLAGGRVEEAHLARLAQFTSEQQNPGNTKKVTAVLVEHPAELLESGVVFADTPGLGALEVSGEVETLAYLPRCDLAVVLVDANTGLTRNAVSLLRTLYESGSPAMMIISKADQLSPAQRSHLVDYTRAHLDTEVGEGIDVSPVSVLADHQQLADRWREEKLRPLLDRQPELTAASRRRKVACLRQAACAILQARLHEVPAFEEAAAAQISREEAQVDRNALRKELEMLKNWNEEVNP